MSSPAAPGFRLIHTLVGPLATDALGKEAVTGGEVSILSSFEQIVALVQIQKVKGKARLQSGSQGWFPKPPKPQLPHLLYII